MKNNYYLIGKKVKVKEEIRYYPSGTQQGFVYKDEKAFITGKGICYLSEYCFQLENNKWVDYLTEEQALKIGETRESIEKQCEDILGDKKYADEVFETVDWQSCNSYICELEDDF